VPASTVRALSEVASGRGREAAFRLQSPQVLSTLTEIARIQSTESSNAIEGITAPHDRIVELVEKKTAPANRSEEEIAGYRKVLDTIRPSAKDIPFKRAVVEQFHRDLYSFTAKPGGRFKSSQTKLRATTPVAEKSASSSRARVRLKPLGRWMSCTNALMKRSKRATMTVCF
jgi:Fic family protein